VADLGRLAKKMKYLANHTQDKSRAVGGSISVESDALCFTPNSIDIRFGGRAIKIQKDEIDIITVEPREISLKEIFSGGIRERMKIVRKDGATDLFVVNNLHSVISDLRKWQNEPK
jgi:hypothetical protein